MHYNATSKYLSPSLISFSFFLVLQLQVERCTSYHFQIYQVPFISCYFQIQSRRPSQINLLLLFPLFVFLLWSRLSARSFSWLSDSISSAGSDFWISIYLGVYRFAYFAWFSAVQDASLWIVDVRSIRACACVKLWRAHGDGSCSCKAAWTCSLLTSWVVFCWTGSPLNWTVSLPQCWWPERRGTSLPASTVISSLSMWSRWVERRRPCFIRWDLKSQMLHLGGLAWVPTRWDNLLGHFNNFNVINIQVRR